MSTDAKRAGNAKYLSKFATVTLRFLPAELDALKATAQAAGESVAGYIKQAIQDRATGRLLPDAVRSEAAKAAEANGEELGAWLARAVTDQAKRDEMIRQLRKG